MKNKKLVILMSLVLCLGVFGYWFNASYLSIENVFNKKPKQLTEEELLEQEKSEIAKQLGEYNVLILGLDSEQGFNRTRTDSIILATIDTKNRKAQMISIPRDTRVQIKGSWDKINAAYAYGGAELATEAVEDFLGVTIDRHVILNFNSLREIVDAINGIEVDVLSRMYYPDENINLHPGKQLLMGEDVLAYTRFRNDTQGDIGRAKRQQEVIQLVAGKIFGIEGLKNLPTLINIAIENVQTDIPTREILALAKLGPDVVNNQVATMVVPGKNERIDGLWYWSPDLEELEKQLTIFNTVSIAKEDELVKKEEKNI